MSDTISFRLNDKPVRLNVDANRVFLWILRTDLGLTGAKFGCGEGHCGACTVLVDKVAVRTEDARDFLSGQGIDVEALAPQVDGKFMSAFVRAVKPRGAKACCGPTCCN